MVLRMFRRIYRFIGVVLWTTYVGLRVLPSRFGKGAKKMKHCSMMTQLWTDGLAKIMGIHIAVRNSEYAPNETGGFIVSNHMSYLDIIVHATLTPVRFAPKHEIRRWPFIGFVVGLSRPVWVYRQNRQKAAETLRQFEETMCNGVSMLVYPEGTTTDGTHILEFKTTPFEAPIEIGAELRPMIMIYERNPGEKTLCWYGDMSLLPHAWMVFGRKRIDVTIYWMPPEKLSPGMNRKTVAASLRERMMTVLQEHLPEGTDI